MSLLSAENLAYFMQVVTYKKGTVLDIHSSGYNFFNKITDNIRKAWDLYPLCGTV